MSERAQQIDDADATVVLPTPGRKRSSAFAPAIERQAAGADLAALGGLNPLVEAANPILAAVPQIRHALRHADPLALRERLREQIDGFERSAVAAGVADDPMKKARFALCALLDDSAAATPWGHAWAGKGVVAEVEGQAYGGEKFFTLLDEMLAAPEGQVEVLEFFYACLALGFEGKYRSGDRQGLAQTRTRLYGFIEQRRGNTATELSARWRGAQIRAKLVPGALALWGVASAWALVLAALYFVYSVLLGVESDPVARELAQLKLPPLSIASAATKPVAAVRAGPSATDQLAKTIGSGDVEVSRVADGTLILFKGDQLFPAGSARPDAKVQPVIERVARALDQIPGAVLVTGHTDDQPIRTARFPSNWELSTERARNVVAMMAAEMKDPARLRAEGLADSDPLVPNDSAANRAKNRRVAIILRSGS